MIDDGLTIDRGICYKLSVELMNEIGEPMEGE